MANRTIAIVVSDEDHVYMEKLAGEKWTYVATVARNLLAAKISEVRAADVATTEE